MSLLDGPRSFSRALHIWALAALLLVAGCLVENPAYDPSPRKGQVDAATDSAVVADVNTLVNPRDIDARFVPDTASAKDAITPDVVGDSMVISAAPPFCDSKDPALSLCLTFDGDVIDHSANAISLLGVPNFVSSIDGSAYQVSAAEGLRSTANAAFVSTQLTVDLWVRLSALPETQLQALAVVPGVVSVAVTGSGQVVCDVGGIGVTSPVNTLKLNTWTGISCTYDSIAINIYANGQSEAGRGDSSIVPMVTKSTISIGSAVGFSPFTGDIDNLRFWRKRLTPSELCKIAPECPH